MWGNIFYIILVAISIVETLFEIIDSKLWSIILIISACYHSDLAINIESEYWLCIENPLTSVCRKLTLWNVSRK